MQTTTPAITTPRTRNRFGRTVKMVALVSTLGGFMFGYDTGVISGALPYLMLSPAKGGLSLTPVTEGLVTTALTVGAVFGALLAGRISDAIGRRRTLSSMAILFLIGSLGCALAPSVAVFFVARLVLGLAVGASTATVPTFIGEMAPKERRGQLVARNELMVVSGQLIAYVSNAIIAQFGSEGGSWRIMLGLATLPAVALWIGMRFVPESPRWFAAHGKIDAAMGVLRRVRSDEAAAAAELAEISDALRKEETTFSGWREMRTPWVRRVVMIGAGIAFFSQMTGVNAVMYFAPTILIQTGLGATASITATIANGVVSVVASLIGIRMIRSVGRKRLITTGQIGVTASLLLLAIVYAAGGGAFRSIAVLTCMLVFLFFMQCFIAPVYWVLLSEIFPNRARGVSNGLAVLWMWVANIIVSFLFPILISTIGAGTFFIFVGINVISIVFYFIFVPETRNKSLEQIEQELEARYTTASASRETLATR